MRNGAVSNGQVIAQFALHKSDIWQVIRLSIKVHSGYQSITVVNMIYYHRFLDIFRCRQYEEDHMVLQQQVMCCQVILSYLKVQWPVSFLDRISSSQTLKTQYYCHKAKGNCFFTMCSANSGNARI